MRQIGIAESSWLQRGGQCHQPRRQLGHGIGRLRLGLRQYAPRCSQLRHRRPQPRRGRGERFANDVGRIVLRPARRDREDEHVRYVLPDPMRHFVRLARFDRPHDLQH
jgi:hypothetical protein